MASSRGKTSVKVVQYKGKRRSFRLENIFWETLASISARRRIRVGRLVDEIAERNEAGQSLASALRVECMLDAERQLVSARLSQNDVKTQLIDLAPSPCVFLSETAAILGGNRAFYGLISGEGEKEVLGQRFTDLCRVQTSISFNEFWINLQKRPGRPLTAHVHFLRPSGITTGQAIFVAERNKENQFIGATTWLAVTASRNNGE